MRTKEITVGLSLIVLLLASFVWVKTSFDIKRESDLKTQKEFFEKGLDSTVKYWVDKDKRSHSEIDKMYVEVIQSSEYIDSITNLLNISRKQIQSIEYVKTKQIIKEKLVTQIEYKEVPCDSNRNIKTVDKIKFNWKDSWTNISGVVTSKGDNDSLFFESVDTLHILNYWRRDKVLGAAVGRKRFYVDYSNSNPHVKVIGAKKLEVKGRDSQYSLNLSVNLGYPVKGFDIKRPQLSVGISFGKQLIKF